MPSLTSISGTLRRRRAHAVVALVLTNSAEGTQLTKLIVVITEATVEVTVDVKVIKLGSAAEKLPNKRLSGILFLPFISSAFIKQIASYFSMHSLYNKPKAYTLLSSMMS